MSLFHLELLPPVERRPNGSLPRMNGRQRQRAVSLIRKLCSACDNGNCLYLDDGEEVPCPQTISYSVCCKIFRWVLLKDKAGGELETEIFGNASYTFRDIDGTEHFCCGDTSITVSEHFRPAGKQPEELIEDVIQYAARTNRDS